MSIKYVKVQQNITTGATTVSYPEILAALKAFGIVIFRHILNCEAVKLGILRMFAPGIKAMAKTILADIDATTIKRAHYRFYPSPKFKQQLDKSRFKDSN